MEGSSKAPYSLDSRTTSSPADLFGDQPFTHLCDTLPTFQNLFQVSKPVSIRTSDPGFSRVLLGRTPNTMSGQSSRDHQSSI